MNRYSAFVSAGRKIGNEWGCKTALRDLKSTCYYVRKALFSSFSLRLV